MSDTRLAALTQWCEQQCQTHDLILSPVSGDASFRRYFRFSHAGKSLIAMDAPPEKENSAPFLAIASQWMVQGISVPEVLHHDLSLGFLILEDFGSELLMDTLVRKPNQADKYYQQAIDELIKIQALPDACALPAYDEALLRREMQLLPEWLLSELLNFDLNEGRFSSIKNVFDLLVEQVLEQPLGTVHRDYHSRNLMCLENGTLGVIDFQDAVHGSICYDLVSLLKDCYIAWPTEKIDEWVHYYLARSGSDIDFAKFRKAFDLMGMQRHLKAAGIFARLYLRDGKDGYLKDIPRTLNYIVEACDLYESEYSELGDFGVMIRECVLPSLSMKLIELGIQ